MSKIQDLLCNGSVDDIVKGTASYCPLAWMHFHLSTESDVRICCVSAHGEQHSLGNINTHTYEQIWNGAAYLDFRRNMLHDLPNAACQSCVSTESTIGWSHRHNMIRQYHHQAVSMIKQTNVAGVCHTAHPTYLDIRFNNLCNLRCRSCGLFASSRWFNDEVALGRNHTAATSAYIGIQDSTPLLDSLDEVLPHVEEIYFAGGEPMIMAENFIILDKLIEIGNTDLLLRFNTNLMNVVQFEKYAHHFTNIKIMASIDAQSEQLELLRKDCKWTTILDNLSRMKSYPSIQLEVTCTIQILNVHEAYTLHRTLYEMELIGIDGFFYHLLHAPSQYNIQNLPDHLKSSAVDAMTEHVSWITGIKQHATNIQGIHHCIAYINAKSSSETQLSRLGKFSHQLDKLRGENSPHTFPRLREIWDKYYPGLGYDI